MTHPLPSETGLVCHGPGRLRLPRGYWVIVSLFTHKWCPLVFIVFSYSLGLVVVKGQFSQNSSLLHREGLGSGHPHQSEEWDARMRVVLRLQGGNISS